MECSGDRQTTHRGRSRILLPIGVGALCAAVGLAGCSGEPAPGEPAPVVEPAATLADATATAPLPPSTPEAFALVETEPGIGDPDDAAIWVHPTDPAASRIIATDKAAGFVVYDLAGRSVQAIGGDFPNNVDLRYGFPWGDGTRALVTGGYRRNGSLAILTVDEATGEVEEAEASGAPLGFEPYGSCMYRSPADGSFYVFVNAVSGDYRQYRLDPDPATGVSVELVRSFRLASQPEGCVADDERRVLYVGEEAAGISRVDAEPDGSTRPVLVDSVADGRLVADVEGLTLYRAAGGAGYLIASSQGSSEFVVYERGTGRYVMTFRIGVGVTDAVTETDGIAVVSAGLGPGFPNGLFVAHDPHDETGAAGFKLVPWEAIATLADPPLTVDPTMGR